MIVVILAVVIGGGYYAYQELVPPPEEEVSGPIYSTQPVTRGDISVGVEASGPLNPSSGGGIQVPGGRNYMMDTGGGTSYVIDQILVKEGDVVKQGDLLFQLAAPNLQSQIESKQEELMSAKKLLASLMGVPIDQVEQINPADGIIIRAPIDGRVINLNYAEGETVKQGERVAQIVDDSRFQLTAKLTPGEFEQITKDHRGVLRFPAHFSEAIPAEIVDINPNPIPMSSSELHNELYSGNGDDQYEFVYWVTLEADNPGLIRPDMEAEIGFVSPEAVENEDEIDYHQVNWIRYGSKVEKFVNEKNLLSSAEGIVTQVFVHQMENVKANDPIIALAGQDVREKIMESLNDIRDLKMELQQLKAQKDMLEVKAPIDGVVSHLNGQIGQNVGPGEWLGSIYQTSDMRMWVQVDDMDILLVKQGSPVEVTVDALPDKKFTGEVEQVSTRGTDNNGITRFDVMIKVQGSGELRPGMQAKAYIKAGDAKDVLLIPLEAVFQEDGQNKVEVLQPDGTPKVVTVDLGLMNDRVAEVKSGLEEGDKVITGSTADLLPSQKIQSNTLLPGQTNDDNQDNGNEQNNSESK